MHYPTTLAPHFGEITVSTECADNAALATGSSLSVRCSFSSSWSGITPQCQCNTGYRETGDATQRICEGLHANSYQCSYLNDDIFSYSKLPS